MAAISGIKRMLCDIHVDSSGSMAKKAAATIGSSWRAAADMLKHG